MLISTHTNVYNEKGIMISRSEFKFLDCGKVYQISKLARDFLLMLTDGLLVIKKIAR